jgi:tellurite resistance protein TehA-like permease
LADFRTTDYFLDLPPSQSLAMPAEVEDKDVESGEKVTFLDRISHFTLNWWLVTMGTGSIAVLLGQQPHTFKGLQTIGKVVFIWDLFLFIIICLLTAIRFYRQPSLFVRAFRNPAEALFSAAFLISINNIIICMQEYGVSSTGPWMIITLRIVFWIYVAISFILGVSVYLELFTARHMTTQDILPAWLLPILPIMLSGSIAGSIASMQPTYYRQSILVAGVTFQGLGFWLAISLYGPIFIRLMKIGLPAPALRPGD